MTILWKYFCDGVAKVVKDADGKPRAKDKPKPTPSLAHRLRLGSFMELLQCIKDFYPPSGMALDPTKITLSQKKDYQLGQEFTKTEQVLGRGKISGDIVVLKDIKTGTEHAQKTMMISCFRPNEIRCRVDLNDTGYLPCIYHFKIEGNQLSVHMEISRDGMPTPSLAHRLRLGSFMELLQCIKDFYPPSGMALDPTKITLSQKKDYQLGQEFTKTEQVLGRGKISGDIVVLKDIKTGTEHAQKTMMISCFRPNEIRCRVDLNDTGYLPCIYHFKIEGNQLSVHMEISRDAKTLRGIIDDTSECPRSFLRPFSLYVLDGAMKAISEMHRKGWDHKDLNHCKIYQLRWKLLTLGTAVLQKLFDYRVGNDFTEYLTTNEAEETKLNWLMDTNRITEQQVALLSKFRRTTSSSYVHKSEQTLPPTPDLTASSSLKFPKLDISLLTVLLRYVCGLRAPNDLVWKEPSPMDMSIEADICRLGQCRNSIMKLKHIDTQNVDEFWKQIREIKKYKHYDEDMVDELWKKLHEILTRLGRRVGITDEFFSSAGDAMFNDIHMLKQWYENDQRQIQIEHEPKMFFKDSDDDAWTIDEEDVSVLLSEGLLPNAKQLENFCEKFGSSSPTVRKVCAYICNTLQMTSHHIKRCWPAYVYDSNNENDTNLVTFVVVKDIEDKLHIDRVFGYNIYELFRGSNRGETSMMMDHDIKNANKFNDEMDKIEKYVSDQSLSLMHNHSNITLIAGSTVKSKRYMFENKEIIENPCVVIYVHLKGYIPLGEKPFPTKLNDEFDTDVRECVISLYRNDAAHRHNDNLLMGTSISNRDFAGTLGGFVEHPDYGLCGLTCAHVLCDIRLMRSSEVEHWPKRDKEIKVFQPAFQLEAPIGEVKSSLFRQDDRVGIDIALFSILDRHPISGQFAIDATKGLHINEYNSGSVLPREDIQRGATIIKYGSETGRTESHVVTRSSCLKDRDGRYTLNKQLLVKNEPSQEHFAVEGDSGALSFVENDNGLHAIGVVLGGDSEEETCCLTPLYDILDAFNEHNEVQVSMKILNVPGEQMEL